MTTSATRKRFQYAATLLGALAIVALAPATANAQPVNNTGDGGCHYTDKDGYDIPIDDGQSVLVDGKTVTCNGGTITVSNKAGTAGVRPGLATGNLPVLAETPKKPTRVVTVAPVLTENVAVFQAQP